MCDYVLLPNTVNVRVRPRRKALSESHLCPWNQTLPFVIRAVPQTRAACATRFCLPRFTSACGHKHVEKELAEFARER